MTGAETVLSAYRAKGLHIATAESCTGGLLSGTLTDIAGSSDVFDRGFVTYSNQAKIEMLGVSPATLDGYGAVSEQTAREMAEGALARAKAEVAVSITGIAGPGGSEFKPEGRVCFALAAEGRDTITLTMDFGAIGRTNVRQASVMQALELLQRAAS